MIQWVFRKIVGSKNQRELKRVWPQVKEISQIEERLQAEPEEALRQRTEAWKAKLSKIEDGREFDAALDEILPEAFAVVKNAARRLCGTTVDVCGQPVDWNMATSTSS